jgi:hypothetical protein
MQEIQTSKFGIYHYWNDKLHRENGPAVEYFNGSKCWYLYGQRHREDGPTIEFADGDKEWYLHDQLHRENGPAIECANGNKRWFLQDKEYSEEEYWRILKLKGLW